MSGPSDNDELLSPREAAEILKVKPEAVSRMATAGLLHPVRTPGGHRRYRKSEVLELHEKRKGWEKERAKRRRKPKA